MSPNTKDPEAERVRFRNEMERIEAILLDESGLAFPHKELLHQAFQHSSFLKENVRAVSYERLEFLGDRVLELCVADWLYKAHPKADEGFLSKELAWRVDEANLARVDEKLQVKKALRLGPGINAGEISDKMVADVVEALIGAIYLDIGLESSERFIQAFVLSHRDPPPDFNSTNELLETCIDLAMPTPQFIEVKEGPDNRTSWNVECVVGALRTSGKDKRKRDAKKKACQAMLASLPTGKMD
jgi:ribonuclease-3